MGNWPDAFCGALVNRGRRVDVIIRSGGACRLGRQGSVGLAGGLERGVFDR